VTERPPGEPASDPGDRLVTIARCATPAMADLVRSVLADGGIEVVLQDQYLSQLFGFVTPTIGGVKVQVRARDAQAAVERLRAPVLLAPDVPTEEAGEDAPPAPATCPECGSTRASFHPVGPFGFVIDLVEKVVPLPFLHGHWVCAECGKRWLDPDLPGSSGRAGNS
jgi:rubredoxin